MSRWDDRFEEHPVFKALGLARQQLDASDPVIQEADDRESHSRLTRVVDYVEGALRATDPELVPFGVLDQLANGLKQVAAYLGQYAVGANAALLDQANGQVALCLEELRLNIAHDRVEPSVLRLELLFLRG